MAEACDSTTVDDVADEGDVSMELFRMYNMFDLCISLFLQTSYVKRM
jgi:hypothetical protein